MLNYKLVVERTLHVETPRGLALLSVGDEVFLKLHGYGWLFGTIIALGHDTMLVAGHDLDESKRVAYRCCIRRLCASRRCSGCMNATQKNCWESCPT